MFCESHGVGKCHILKSRKSAVQNALSGSEDRCQILLLRFKYFLLSDSLCSMNLTQRSFNLRSLPGVSPVETFF